MKTTARLAALSALAALFTPALALAQEPGAPADDAQTASSEPGAAPADAASPAAPASVAVPAAVTITVPPCRLAEHAGIDEASAQTASQVVCDAILHAGASPSERYRVSLGRLGSVVVLGVAQEGSTVGSTMDSRQMRLQGIEEITVAAPRIAESIVHGTPLPDTEKVDNLVGEETRQPKSRPGKTHFALGLVGITPPLDRGLTPAPGADLDVHYETGNQKFELGGSMRFGGGSGGNTTDVLSGFFVLSLGGRLYTTDTDFSPYVGGGLTWSYLNLSLPSAGFSGDGSGLGAYVDAGVEVLRTHHAHLAVGLRLDVPFFNINDNHTYESGVYCGNGGCGTQGSSAPNSVYYAPISLETRLTF